MPKKKKVKAKKKGKKHVKSGMKKKQTEEELLQLKVEQLKQELEVADKRLKERVDEWQETMDLSEKQMARKEAIVSHLKGLLSEEHQKYLASKDRLQEEKELSELTERRVLGKTSAAHRSADVERRLFQQQKTELEGKLPSLEKRQKRSSLQAQLRRAEDALQEKESVAREAEREEDSSQAGALVRDREVFLRNCARIRAQWRSAFDIRLSVLARMKLEDNLRLRRECQEEVNRVLSRQVHLRRLEERIKAAKLEEEISQSVDDHATSRISRLEKDIRRVKQEVDKLEVENSLERVVDACSTDGVKSTRDLELKYYRIMDRKEEASAILLDQSQHRASLEQNLARVKDNNDALSSAIHKAQKIFRERCSSGSAPPGSLDFEVLRQIRQMLDLAEVGPTELFTDSTKSNSVK